MPQDKTAQLLLSGVLAWASRTGQSFCNGAFVLVDEFDGLKHPIFTMLQKSPGAAPRISSHLHNLNSGQPEQWGVDVPPTSWEGKNELAHATTLLFCRMVLNERPLLFLKPERYGVHDNTSMLLHGLDYIQTRPMVAAVVGEVKGAARKERIPSHVVEAFMECVDETMGGLDHASASRAGEAGVHAMVKFLLQAEEDIGSANMSAGDVGGARRGRSPSMEAWVEVESSWNENGSGSIGEDNPLGEEASSPRPASTWRTASRSTAEGFQKYVEVSLGLSPELAALEEGFLYRVGMEVFLPAEASRALYRALMLRRLPDVDPRLANFWGREVVEIPAATEDNPMGPALGDTTLLLLLASASGRGHFLDFLHRTEHINTSPTGGGEGGGAIAVSGELGLDASHLWMLRVLPAFLASEQGRRAALGPQAL